MNNINMPDFEKRPDLENKSEDAVLKSEQGKETVDFIKKDNPELKALVEADDVSSEARAQELIDTYFSKDAFSREKFADMLEYVQSGTLLTGEAEQTLEYKAAQASVTLDKAMKSNPDWANGQFDGKEMAKETMASLPPSEQESLADSFFDNTFSDGLSSGKLRGAYNVYVGLKGTPFSSRFAQREDQRLKEAGSAGFTL
jgi:hypothetical protein